ncbi:MAG: alpha/beta hydrolase [Candidatus Competibacteraceae bacterium]|nr:alpha/beta hydrolase [Candidatus Competibacteraceae bacterium]
MQHFATNDGTPIHVRILGQGTPIVFLHGWTSSHQEWLPYGKALGDCHQVYCWDARGHGASPAQDAPTIERMARDLQQLIAHYDLHKPVLMGHSMGALTVWEYIRQSGCADLGGICLIDQSPRLLTDTDWPLGIYGNFSPARNRDFIAELKTDFAEAVLRLAAAGLNARFTASYERNSVGCQMLRQYLQGLDSEPLIGCWESLSQSDYREVLPTITVPTLLIYGAESTFYTLETAHYVRDHIPNADLRVYENTDHSPHLWQPERFIADFRTFVGEPFTVAENLHSPSPGNTDKN